ncbi:hypothetical protein TD95_002029 [Thielaviopsis punctulata]|uniref:Uncharacterized protein n=1 Tax=Thielaviopsis punctulata TaxID=72032 RepID=A0A0F4ZA42_9PEZI|nr:hypothetical protein TD95_002029 [Thielaviopsis punctulata]
MADAGDQPSSQPRKLAPPRFIPPGLSETGLPALKTGSGFAAAGFLCGVPLAILKDAPPMLWGLSMGVQWFMLSSTFTFARGITVRTMGGSDTLSDTQRIQASAIGGCISGTTGGLMRSPGNIIPGAVVFTLGSILGQMGINSYYRNKPTGPQEPLTERLLSHKWSPFRRISDAEYIEIMEEKILKAEAQIALIDDRISELRMLIKQRDAAEKK